jgi:hypothetical protein
LKVRQQQHLEARSNHPLHLQGMLQAQQSYGQSELENVLDEAPVIMAYVMIETQSLPYSVLISKVAVLVTATDQAY